MICKYKITLLFVISVFIGRSQSASFTPPGAISLGDFDIPGNQLTVEAIIYWRGGANILTKHTDPTNLNYLFRPNSGEFTTYNTGNSGATTFYNMGNPNPTPNNTWIHLAVVYNGSTAAFFVNGCQTHSIPVTGNMMQNDIITTIGGFNGGIGNYGVNPGEYFDGDIDELRIWNVARSQAQISANMNDLPTYATEPGLLAYYKFDGDYNNLVPGPNGIATGGVSFGAEHPTIEPFSIDSITTVNSCTGNDGALTVYTNQTNVDYSLDGVTYGASPTFTGLTPNTYTVYCRSFSGCIETQTATVSPAIIATVSPTTDINACVGQTVSVPSFNPTPGTASVTWTNNNTAIGLAASGTGDIASFAATNTTNAPITAQIIVTPTEGTCPGTKDTFDITINPIPSITPIIDTTLCENEPLTVTFNSNVTGTQYNWTNSNTSIGLGANGNGTSINFTASNNQSSAISSSVTVTGTFNGCSSSSEQFNIQVNPAPTALPINDTTVCNGENIPSILLQGSPSGGTSSWQNSNINIGIAMNGVDSIPSFIANNPSTNPISGTITYSNTLNGCTSNNETFVITVNPTPNITPVPNIEVCAGNLTGIPPFQVDIPGSTTTWTNTNSSIGLPSSGSGNIPPFFSTNNSGANITGTIDVVASINGCDSPTETFDITIKPRPTIGNMDDIVACSGNSVMVPNFNVTPASATITWTNSDSTYGLASSGTGNIASFTAINPDPTIKGGLISATAELNGCTSFSEQFTIAINHTPEIIQINDTGACGNETLDLVDFQTSGTNPTITWTNTEPSIGIPSNGVGNIQPFNVVNNPTQINAVITTTASENGCTGSPMSYIITINPTPSLAPYQDIIACQTEMVNPTPFTVSPTNAIISWTETNNSFTNTGTGNLPSFTAPGNNIDTNYATVDVVANFGFCLSDTLTFDIIVKPKPILSPLDDIIVCALETVSLPGFTSTIPNAVVSWTNDNPNVGILDNGTGDIPSFTTPHTGTDTLTANLIATAERNGCFSIPITFNIQVNPNELSSPNDFSFCAKDLVIAPDGYMFYSWSDGQSGQSIYIENQQYYTLTATDSSGCLATKEFYANETCNYMFFPNAFTPNNDGFNDEYKPSIVAELKSYNFTIFDRWGTLVFETDNYDKGWDGLINNAEAPSGVFSDRLKYDELDNIDTQVKKGHFILLR